MPDDQFDAKTMLAGLLRQSFHRFREKLLNEPSTVSYSELRDAVGFYGSRDAVINALYQIFDMSENGAGMAEHDGGTYVFGPMSLIWRQNVANLFAVELHHKIRDDIADPISILGASVTVPKRKRGEAVSMDEYYK